MKVLYVLLAAAASVAAQTECEPHEDHWHCPEGVEEPTYLPGQEPAATAGASSAASSATPSVTASPSATETDDHDDHDVSLTASGVCEPHGDHWHCPEGVPEPTTAPALSATTPAPSASATSDHDHDDDDHAATASTCEPHGDHWHCPSGVAEPTTAPAAETTAAGTGAAGASTSGTAPAASQATGAAAAVGASSGGVFALALGAFGALFI